MAYPHVPLWLDLLEAMFEIRQPGRVGHPPKSKLRTRLRHWLGWANPDEPKDFEW